MKFLSAFALCLTASTAIAQGSSDNFEMAKLGITMNGYDCDQVMSVTPTENEDVLEITCKKSAGSNAEVVYMFTIDGAGFSVAPK
ncbi:MAG: hypothetical protein COB08_008275 [Rhodobacteraceae bacterium]|nr:hypothetical protein [Paracoccaceae bacterium]